MKFFFVYPLLGSSPSYSSGVGSLAAVVREDGHEAAYLRLQQQEDIERFLRRVSAEQPDVIGFSLTSCQYQHIKRLLPRVRQRSRALLIAGGIHPSVRPDCLETLPELDAIVRGEGEQPLRQLAAALVQGKDYYNTPNFWFRRRHEIVRNGMGPLITDLDSLPFPYRDPEDYQSVIDETGGMHRMIFSRGCTFGCPYCTNQIMIRLLRGKGKFHRARTPAKAIEEIHHDAALFRFKFIFFDDDTITLDRAWCLEFFRLYREHFHYPFYCNVRPGTADAEIVRTMTDAGMKGVALGIEHGNEQFRKEVLKRSMSNDELERCVRLFYDHGVKEVFGQLMVGLPHENMSLFLDSVRLCRRLTVVPFRYIYQPYPGTELGELCEKNGWMPQNDFYAERREAVIDFPGFSRQDIQLCFDVFTLLARVRFLPLQVPGVRTRVLLKFYRMFSSLLVPALRRALHSWRGLRRYIVVGPGA